VRGFGRRALQKKTADAESKAIKLLVHQNAAAAPDSGAILSLLSTNRY